MKQISPPMWFSSVPKEPFLLYNFDQIEFGLHPKAKKKEKKGKKRKKKNPDLHDT